jgi:hypothetical protein
MPKNESGKYPTLSSDMKRFLDMTLRGGEDGKVFEERGCMKRLLGVRLGKKERCGCEENAGKCWGDFDGWKENLWGRGV